MDSILINKDVNHSDMHTIWVNTYSNCDGMHIILVNAYTRKCCHWNCIHCLAQGIRVGWMWLILIQPTWKIHLHVVVDEPPCECKCSQVCLGAATWSCWLMQWWFASLIQIVILWDGWNRDSVGESLEESLSLAGCHTNTRLVSGAPELLATWGDTSMSSLLLSRACRNVRLAKPGFPWGYWLAISMFFGGIYIWADTEVSIACGGKTLYWPVDANQTWQQCVSMGVLWSVLNCTVGVGMQHGTFSYCVDMWAVLGLWELTKHKFSSGPDFFCFDHNSFLMLNNHLRSFLRFHPPHHKCWQHPCQLCCHHLIYHDVLFSSAEKAGMEDHNADHTKYDNEYSPLSLRILNWRSHLVKATICGVIHLADNILDLLIAIKHLWPMDPSNWQWIIKGDPVDLMDHP